FNAPVWSVSVEVFLYGTFFALFRVFRRRTIPLIALVVLGAVLKFHIPIGRGIYSFFLGGLAYYAFSELRARGLIPRLLKPLALLAILGCVAVVVGLRIEVVRDWSQSSVDALGRATNLLATGVLMPLTLLVLAMTETAKRGPWKRISFLGDISYSSYMLHFPLQLAVVAVA